MLRASAAEGLGERSLVEGVDGVTWLTFYLVVLFAIPSRLVVAPLGSAGALSMLMGLGSFGIWLLLRVGRWQATVSHLAPTRMAVAAFLFTVGLSYALAMSRPISRDEVSPADVALLCLLAWSGTLLIAHDAIPSLARLHTFVWRAALGGGLMASLGIVQFVTKQTLADRISVPGLTAMTITQVGFRDGRVRPSGTALSPIEYGSIIAILLPLALHVGFHETRRAPLVRWFPAAAICAMIAVSSSRSAYLGALVSIGVCMLGWSAARRWVMLVVALGGVGLAAVAAPRLLASVTSLFTGASEDPSVESRTDSYSVAWTFFAHHPWFGRGLGTFLPKYRIFDNEYLGLLVCVGVVGLLAFLMLLIVTLVQLARAARASAEPRVKDLSCSLAAAVASGFTSLAFFDAFAFPMTMGTIFLLLGVAGALCGLVASARPRRRTPIGGASRATDAGSTPVS